MINSVILLVLIALFEKYCHDRYCENLHHDESLSRDLNSNLGLEKKLVELYLVYFNQHIFFCFACLNCIFLHRGRFILK